MAESETQQLQQAQAGEKPAQEQGGIRTYDRWQLFYLDRLHGLSALSRDIEAAGVEPFHEKALKRAVFSTLLDCDAAGVGDEARKIVSGK